MKRNKIIKATLIIMCISLFSTFAPISMPAYADICDDPNSPIYEASGCGTQKEIEPIIGNILSVIIGMLGLVAVIFIVMGGVQYMTSSGDANKLKKAKDTILYGLIGLIVCALAFALVNFVISNILNQ